MTDSSLSKNGAWAAVVAEAASWIALLHGPDRTPAAERGLKRWLEEDPLHAKAFELATETWNETRAFVKRGAKVKLILRGEEGTRRGGSPWLAAVAACIAGALVVAGFYYQSSKVVTGVGERRVLALEDGTQVYLNTATRVAVNYDGRLRHVRLDAGEALFEVAKRPGWPFVVSAGDRDITALGTAFLVRRDAKRTAITLVDGKVRVAKREGKNIAESVRELAPGERVIYPDAAVIEKVDRPELQKLTAWQNGKVNIDNLTLGEAVMEMNRYSKMLLKVEGIEASNLRLSGVFRIGDSRNFANAVARTHGLQMREEDRQITLSGVPRSR